jgi:hypothetical protein
VFHRKCVRFREPEHKDLYQLEPWARAVRYSVDTAVCRQRQVTLRLLHEYIGRKISAILFDVAVRGERSVERARREQDASCAIASLPSPHLGWPPPVCVFVTVNEVRRYLAGTIRTRARAWMDFWTSPCPRLVYCPCVLFFFYIFIHVASSTVILKNLVSQLQPPFILLFEFNAKNILWGAVLTDGWGRSVYDVCAGFDLILLNTGAHTHPLPGVRSLVCPGPCLL